MRNVLIALVLIILLFSGIITAANETQNTSADITSDFTNRLPLMFTENSGQWADNVLFRAQTQNATMWYTTDGIYYQMVRNLQPDDIKRHKATETADEVCEQLVFRTKFIGVNPNPEVQGYNKLDYYCNYYLSSDQSRWRERISNYAEMSIKEIYPGIDLNYYSDHNGNLEYDLVVGPGADISQIKIRYENVKSLDINQPDLLSIETDWNTINEIIPDVYQLENGNRIPVRAEFRKIDDYTFGFTVKDDYNQDQEIIIDPVLKLSTYLGGSGNDWGAGVASIYGSYVGMTGYTYSADFPTLSPQQGTFGGSKDVFFTIFDTLGVPLSSTYLGGDGSDEGLGIDFAEGFIGITGQASSNFPTMNAYQSTFGGSYDAFAAIFNVYGILQMSTYLGGSSGDRGLAITGTDDSGEFWITGFSFSVNYPLVNEYHAYQGSTDIILSKINKSGVLSYSSYLGGSENEYGRAIDYYGSTIFITGDTDSDDIPSANTYQGGKDAFIAYLSEYSDLSLGWFAYLGGSADDIGEGICFHDLSMVSVVGGTASPDFPVINSATSYSGDWDIFHVEQLAGVLPNQYSALHGGSDYDYAMDIDFYSHEGVDYCCIVGETSSSDFPTVNPYQSYQEGSDGFIILKEQADDELVYSTYFGGSSYDYISDVVLAYGGNGYFTGMTISDDFPTMSEYQGDQAGYDAFLSRFQMFHRCGDLNFDGFIGTSDLVFLLEALLGTYELSPYANADYNNCGSVELADYIYLINALYNGGPDACEGGVDCYAPADGNLVKLNSGYNVVGHPGDTLYIPISITVVDSIDGISLGFNSNNSDAEITDIVLMDTSNFSGVHTNIDDTNNEALIMAWPVESEIPSGTEIQLAQLKIEISPSATDATVNLDSSFVLPHGEFIFCTPEGGTILPDFNGITLTISTSVGTCGDANSDLSVDISDAVYIINYAFGGGPAPSPIYLGDANCDSSVDISDAVYVINFAFGGGNQPCDPSGDGQPDC